MPEKTLRSESGPTGVWVLRYYSPAKKCKLDSAWVGPYLVVSLAGWALGIQRHPDLPANFLHFNQLINHIFCTRSV